MIIKVDQLNWKMVKAICDDNVCDCQSCPLYIRGLGCVMAVNLDIPDKYFII